MRAEKSANITKGSRKEEYSKTKKLAVEPVFGDVKNDGRRLQKKTRSWSNLNTLRLHSVDSTTPFEGQHTRKQSIGKLLDR